MTNETRPSLFLRSCASVYYAERKLNPKKKKNGGGLGTRLHLQHKMKVIGMEGEREGGREGEREGGVGRERGGEEKREREGE